MTFDRKPKILGRINDVRLHESHFSFCAEVSILGKTYNKTLNFSTL